MQERPHIDAAEIQAFEGYLRGASRIGIVSHTRPDGDAVGSCLALKRFVEALEGVSPCCRILLDTDAPDAVRFLFSPADEAGTLVFVRDAGEAVRYAAGCDLLVFLDLNRFSRAGGLEPVLRDSKARKILVDHHLDPDPALFDLAFSQTRVSSTCELLYLILSHCPFVQDNGLPAGCADPLLTGITTDTNNFANSVFGTTLETVSALLDAGADRETILEHIYNEYPERRIRLMGYLLDRELIVTDRGVAVMALDAGTAEAFEIREGETEGFVNLPLAIDRVKMSIFLRQDGGEYRVSIRSKRGWSANRLARTCFDGGGHEQAAGGKILLDDTLKTKADVTARVLACTEQFLSDEA